MLIHEFRYKQNELYCEGVNLVRLARQVGTPCYIYSYRTLMEHLRGLQKAFRPLHPLICYSVKASSNLTLLRALVHGGAGLDIVSGGELFRALKASCPPERIVFAGVGKSEEEIRAALRSEILLFNAESVAELQTLNRLAGKLRKRPRVGLRVNPGVGAGGHAYTVTGGERHKFGIGFETAREILAGPERWPHLRICGLHLHIGSQILSADPFMRAIKKTLSFLDSLGEKKERIRYLDIGGGMGVVYDKERPQTPQQFASKIVPLLRQLSVKVILEPGRFIVANSGVLLTRVLYTKAAARKNFIIVDGGMNDLIRPALYDSFHDVYPLRKLARLRQSIRADVVGPICETGDFLARNRVLAPVAQGDFLAVLTGGAYGFSMSSNYNSRPRAAEVLVRENRYHLIRRRESYKDLIRGETIPAFLR